MRAKLISVGNSKGIRIPKVLIEQCNLRSEVQLEVREGMLVIRSDKKFRQGWEAAFQEMAKRGDDKLLNTDVATAWDNKDWKW